MIASALRRIVMDSLGRRPGGPSRDLTAARLAVAACLVAASACRRGPTPSSTSATPPLAAIEARAALNLPVSRAATSLDREPDWIVTASRSELRIVGDPFVIATIPRDPGHGFSALDKGHDRDDLYVLPIAQALDGVRAEADGVVGAPTNDVPDPATRSARAKRVLAIAADASTTYRLFAEVVAAAAPFGLEGGLVVAVRAGSGVGVIPLRIQPSPGPRHEALAQFGCGLGCVEGLVVVVGRDGVTVEAPSSGAKDDCGDGTRVPLASDGAQDVAAVEALVARLVARVPQSGHSKIRERIVWIEADPEIDLATLVSVIDATIGPPTARRFDFVAPLAPRKKAAP
ncbi:MAG: hypothetical protein ACHREM_27920 [Polyangiales bacterium]